jgi:hypothetical protein
VIFYIPHQPSPLLLLLSTSIRTAGEEMWDRSAATPGVLTTSYNANSVIRGEVLSRRDNGCADNGQQLLQLKVPSNSLVQFRLKHQQPLNNHQIGPLYSLSASSLDIPALIPIFAISGIVDICTTLTLPRTC